MIEKVTSEMRNNYTSIEIVNPLDYKDENQSCVEWCSNSPKAQTPDKRSIKFKVILYQNANKYSSYIYAEPVAGKDGKFLRRLVTFKVVTA